MPTPVPGTYPAYFQNYISLVRAASVHEAIKMYSSTLDEFFTEINETKSTFRYAENKWSIKEVLQHITDAERIFAFRVLSLARGEQTPLPGFDENEYAVNSRADNRSWKSILDEFLANRKSTDLLLQSFDESQLQSSGTTNGKRNTVIAISFVIIGHALHHLNVVKERYLHS